MTSFYLQDHRLAGAGLALGLASEVTSMERARRRSPFARGVLAVSAALLCVLVPGASGSADDFKIVVSAKNPPASIKRQDLARIFLKKTTRWPDGQPLVVVDQSSRTPVRTAFTRDVLKTEGLSQMSAVESYWQQLLFSGRGTPPAIKVSDAEVLAFVSATPGAIGYVSGGADTTGATVVPVEN
jgi:ABC-type phosphate transport system substrate-binding protein